MLTRGNTGKWFTSQPGTGTTLYITILEHNGMSTRLLEALIVEDNPGDVLLIREMLEYSGLSVHASIARNGQTALDMLMRSCEGPSVTIPDLVFLDLNLPIVRGLDVLARMKQVPGLRDIPVVVLTGSLDRMDERRSRDLGAMDYWMKPSSYDEIETLGRRLKVSMEPLIGRESRSRCPNSDTRSVHDNHMALLATCVPYQHVHRSAIEMFHDQNLDIWR
jgi:two-component system, chemotaxis family, response regulator Rcp1